MHKLIHHLKSLLRQFGILPFKVLKRLPNVAKIDGDMVKPTERELAAGTAST